MSDQERTVCKYQGAQITNTRAHIIIRFDERPKLRVPGDLWAKGFRRASDGSYFKANTTIAIQNAQVVMNKHYGEQIQ